jgi:hypothetical protein
MNKFRLSILALSLGLAPALAHADGSAPAAPPSTADILAQIQAMKAKIDQLEAQVQAQQAALDDVKATSDDTAQTADHNTVQLAGIKAATEKDGLKGLAITGMIAPAYVYNKDQQASSAVFLNRSDGSAAGGTLYNYDNSYFGGAYLQFQKTMDDGTKWTLNLAPERAAGSIINGNSIVHEASVSMPVDGDPTTRVVAGQIPDWEGYESTWDNQTKAITHNLLFDFAEATAYTGAGVDITRGEGVWEWKALLGNVNSAREYYGGSGGRAPAAVFRVDYAPSSYDNADIGAFALIGKTPNANAGLGASNGTSNTEIFEADAYMTHAAWGYYGQAGIGKQVGAAANGGDAQWWGLSGMLTYNYTPRLLTFARADYLNDSKNGGGLLGGSVQASSGPTSFNGVNGFGADGNCLAADPTSCVEGANRYALSLGMDYNLTQSTTLKLEYRYDRASQASFYDVSSGGYTNANSLLAGSVVVSF